MSSQYVVIRYDDYLRTLPSCDVEAIVDMMHSYSSSHLFDLVIEKNYNYHNDSYFEKLNDNARCFFESYHPSPIPTDEEYKPSIHEQFLVYNLLKEYLRKIVCFCNTNTESNYSRIRQLTTYYEPNYSLSMVFLITDMESI